jgi:hypothetical protein
MCNKPVLPAWVKEMPIHLQPRLENLILRQGKIGVTCRHENEIWLVSWTGQAEISLLTVKPNGVPDATQYRVEEGDWIKLC